MGEGWEEDGRVMRKVSMMTVERGGKGEGNETSANKINMVARECCVPSDMLSARCH